MNPELEYKDDLEELVKKEINRGSTPEEKLYICILLKHAVHEIWEDVIAEIGTEGGGENHD